MTTSQDFDYSNIDGALTPEQALAALAAEQGDTAPPAGAETGGAPAITTATVDTSTATDDQAGKQAAAAVETSTDAGTTTSAEDPAKNVLLARDGKHTIPYEKLVEARNGEQHWKAQAEALAAREAAALQQLGELQAQAQARAAAGEAPTKTDKMVAAAEEAIEAGADADLFGDFSEDDLKKGIKAYSQQLIQAERASIRAEVLAEVAKELAPLKQAREQTAADAHYDSIYGKHPDADSIAQSTEFKTWVDAQPSAVRATYWGLFDSETGGTAEQIVEVFDAFKQATAPKSNQTAATTTKEAASAAIADTKTEPPSSLSSIPGGHAAGASVLDRTADMSGQEMMHATQDMTPAQIEAWLNRQI